MSRTIPTLDDARREHVRRGHVPCVIFIMDLDDFHLKLKGPRDSDVKQALIASVLAWIRDHAPGGPSIYRHGRDSFLFVYWGQPLNALLPDLFAWQQRFASTSFTATEVEGVRFSFTGAVAEFPAHGGTFNEVIRGAEDTVFEGKETGKNRILVFTPRRMVTKTSYYTKFQLRRLALLAEEQETTDAELLREALDDLIRKYESWK